MSIKLIASAFVFASATAAAAANPVLGPGNLWYPGGVCPSQGPQQPPPPPPNAGAAADVSGDVTIVYPDGTSHVAGVGAAVPIGARVTTGPTGSMNVLLLDDTVLTIGPNSDFIVDEFVYDPSTSIEKFLATITKGVFRFVSGKMTRHDPDNWRLKTPTGQLGFRGTTANVIANPDGSGEISVEEGEVVLTEYDSDKEWVVDAGQKLMIENFQVVGVQ